MVRKLFLILLLLVVCSGLFAVWTDGSGSTAFPFTWNNALPSGSPLPQPWSANPLPPVQLRSGTAQAPSEDSGLCPAVYRVQKGDTAGTIAGRCGMTVVDLMASNPAVADPDRIYAGQELMIESGVVEESVVEVKSAAPGQTITLSARGFAPGASVRIGLGLSRSGYHVLVDTAANDQGNVTASIVIPQYAQSGDSAFVLITTQSVPYQQAVSDGFAIAP